MKGLVSALAAAALLVSPLSAAAQSDWGGMHGHARAGGGGGGGSSGGAGPAQPQGPVGAGGLRAQGFRAQGMRGGFDHDGDRHHHHRVFDDDDFFFGFGIGPWWWGDWGYWGLYGGPWTLDYWDYEGPPPPPGSSPPPACGAWDWRGDHYVWVPADCPPENAPAPPDAPRPPN